MSYWTPDDTLWLYMECPTKLDKHSIGESIRNKILDDIDPMEYYTNLIRSAVPGLDYSTNRDLVIAYITDEDGIQKSVLEYVFVKLKAEVPNLLDFYYDGDDDPGIHREDVEMCLFMYIRECYMECGVFHPNVEIVFQEGCSGLYERPVRDQIQERLEFFREFRAIPNVTLM
jgi:hypothetical protein